MRRCFTLPVQTIRIVGDVKYTKHQVMKECVIVEVYCARLDRNLFDSSLRLIALEEEEAEGGGGDRAKEVSSKLKKKRRDRLSRTQAVPRQKKTGKINARKRKRFERQKYKK